MQLRFRCEKISLALATADIPYLQQGVSQGELGKTEIPQRKDCRAGKGMKKNTWVAGPRMNHPYCFTDLFSIWLSCNCVDTSFWQELRMNAGRHRVFWQFLLKYPMQAKIQMKSGSNFHMDVHQPIIAQVKMAITNTKDTSFHTI